MMTPRFRVRRSLSSALTGLPHGIRHPTLQTRPKGLRRPGDIVSKAARRRDSARCHGVARIAWKAAIGPWWRQNPLSIGRFSEAAEPAPVYAQPISNTCSPPVDFPSAISQAESTTTRAWRGKRNGSSAMTEPGSLSSSDVNHRGMRSLLHQTSLAGIRAGQDQGRWRMARSALSEGV